MVGASVRTAIPALSITREVRVAARRAMARARALAGAETGAVRDARDAHGGPRHEHGPRLRRQVPAVFRPAPDPCAGYIHHPAHNLALRAIECYETGSDGVCSQHRGARRTTAARRAADRTASTVGQRPAPTASQPGSLVMCGNWGACAFWYPTPAGGRRGGDGALAPAAAAGLRPRLFWLPWPSAVGSWHRRVTSAEQSHWMGKVARTGLHHDYRRAA